MRITAAHLDYWRRRKASPRWAFGVNPGESNIDNLVNIHGGVTFTTGERLAAFLCAHLYCEIQRKHDHRDLLEVLWEMARDPGYVSRPRRLSGWCTKWAERILAQREVKGAAVLARLQASEARRRHREQIHANRLARRRAAYAAKKAAAKQESMQ